jgi:hypothetical protein
MKIAFFDTKPYDKASFEKFGKENGINFKYCGCTASTNTLAKEYSKAVK